jgi:predicted Zn finger-like uncharacterized protein
LPYRESEVTDSIQTSCPHCNSSFQVAAEQLQQANGKVRCGNCLQVFNAESGDVDFVAPVLPESSDANPLADFSVKPMSGAYLPQQQTPTSRWAVAMLMLLTILLGAQIWLRMDTAVGQPAIEISQLIVRNHPQRDDALQVDAILRNTSGTSLPLPTLNLLFSTRFGEPRAQRSFSPDDYLHNEDLGNDKLPGRSEVQISLALQNPGLSAINYSASLSSVSKSTD